MPYINVSTSAKVNDKEKLLEEISILVSSLTNKSKRFVMAKIDDNCQMYFDDKTYILQVLQKRMKRKMNLFKYKNLGKYY